MIFMSLLSFWKYMLVGYYHMDQTQKMETSWIIQIPSPWLNLVIQIIPIRVLNHTNILPEGYF